MRRVRRTVGLAVAVVVATAAGAPAGAHAAGTPRSSTPVVLWAVGTPASGVHVYDDHAVPGGAVLALVSASTRRTLTALAVRRLLPHRTYGAHLHVWACGADPAAAGAHYQQVPDPVQPSTDPAYANPRNEVWLDLRTDAAGTARAGAVNPWRYRAAPPRSLVLHTAATSTEPGHAGTAGARVACLTLHRSPR
jgi:Cu-Zn family superoxide dismutase